MGLLLILLILIVLFGTGAAVYSPLLWIVVVAIVLVGVLDYSRHGRRW